MKKALKRWLLLTLVLALTLSLSACGGKVVPGGENPPSSGTAEPGSEDPALKGLKKVRLEHVYKTTYLPETLMDGIDYVQQVKAAGDKIYLVANYDNGRQLEDGTYLSDYGNNLYELDAAAGALKLVRSFPNTNQYDEATSSNSYSYANSITPCEDGSIWYYLEQYYESWADPENYVYENHGSLCHIAADGTELASIDTASLSEMGNFYVQSMNVLKDGSLLLMTGDTIMGMDAQGKVLFKEPMQENAWINNIVQTGSGMLVAMMYNYNPTTYESKEVLMRIDPSNGSMTELGQLPMTNVYNIMGGPGDTLVMQGSSALHTYDINTGATSEMLNWLNSDMNSNRLGNIATLPDGRLLITEYDREYNGSRLAIMEKLDDVVEKYVISFASVYLDDKLQDAIISFNKQNDTYRIQYLDYSAYNTQEDYSGGITKLNYDIISGQIPDIFSMDGLPYDVYASKGLLDDLSKRMEQDTAFDKTKYLESVFTSTSVGGKVYSLIPIFSLLTVAGRSENVGDQPGWTMDAMQALRQRFPNAQMFENMERSNILSQLTGMTLDSFVDPDTGACSFNTPGFIQMLEFIKTFPETIDWDKIYSEAGEDYWANYEEQYRQNRTLLSLQYIYNYAQMKELDNTFGGPVTLVGFPVPEGVGNAIQPQLEIAISARSKLGGVCWDFIKYLLSEEYQSTIDWGFPVCKDCLQRLQDEAMKPTDNGGFYPGGRVYASPASIAIAAGEVVVEDTVSTEVTEETTDETAAPTDDEAGAEDEIAEPEPLPDEPKYDDYWSRPLTQDQADRLNAALRSADTISREHKEVAAIIEEEAGAFFSGQKSAAAVADIIQSRVAIYEAESR